MRDNKLVDLQRERQSRQTMPKWATEADEGDWKGLVYGLLLAIGGVGLLVMVVRWTLGAPQ